MKHCTRTTVLVFQWLSLTESIMTSVISSSLVKSHYQNIFLTVDQTSKSCRKKESEMLDCVIFNLVHRRKISAGFVQYKKVHESQTRKSQILGSSCFSLYVFFAMASRSSRTLNTWISSKSTLHSHQKTWLFSHILIKRPSCTAFLATGSCFFVIVPAKTRSLSHHERLEKEGSGKGGWGVMLSAPHDCLATHAITPWDVHSSVARGVTFWSQWIEKKGTT